MFPVTVFTMFCLEDRFAFSFNLDVRAKYVKTCHRIKEI